MTDLIWSLKLTTQSKYLYLFHPVMFQTYFLHSPPNTQTNKVWMNTLSNIRLSRLESYKTSILLGKCAKVYSKSRHQNTFSWKQGKRTFAVDY